MTDGPFAFMIPNEDPEELKRQHDRAQMAAVAVRHGIDRMINGLDLDDLVSLGQLLRHISDGENYKTAVYFEGRISEKLQSKFNVCPSCGVDHDQEMKDQLDEASKSASTEPSSFKQGVMDALKTSDEAGINKALGDAMIRYIADNKPNIDPDWILENLVGYKVEPPSTILERDMMALYNLDDLWERDMKAGVDPQSVPAEFRGYICNGCGQRYMSIQDRMLINVDACKGCMVKSAHG